MFKHMRTTLNIDDEIMRLVKRRAVESGRTITELVEHALRREVSGQQPRASHFILRWSAVAGKAQPGIDLTDRDSLYDAMERGT
jgi:zona occludens toxin (predicted ATPase)